MLETIINFTLAGHLAGPFLREDLPYPANTVKYISVFGKQKPHGGALRIINDHSSPPGYSFNEGISDETLQMINLHMSSLPMVIISLFLAGFGAVLSKHDMAEAFQTVPVMPEQFPLQALKILGCIYLYVKNTYGDKQACHRFSRVHHTLITKLILPRCQISSQSIEMVVDDVSGVVSHHDLDLLDQFDRTYTDTLAYLGFATKPHDPLGFKAFSKLTTGEVLGFIINGTTLEWSLSREKNDKIIQAIEAVVDPDNVNKPVYVTLKAAQIAHGKLTALWACWSSVRLWLIFITRDLSNYLRKHPEENKVSQQYQCRAFCFTKQARKDLLILRALLLNIHQHWIPLTNPDLTLPAMFDVVTFTDASNKIQLEPGEAGPALGVFTPPQQGVVARAVSFPLPLVFLKGRDEFGQNCGNTILTEGLAVLSALARYPNNYQNRTALFITDSVGLVQNFKKYRGKGLYTAHLIRCLHLTAEKLNCDLNITWQRRRSTPGASTADTLTHQDFSEVPSYIQYQRLENLPKPICNTLLQSVEFSENSFHKLWPRILRYWSDIQ